MRRPDEMRETARGRSGFGLVEVIAATLIVGLVLAVSMRGLARSAARRTAERDQKRAMQLANDLVCEALSNDYQDPDVSGTGSIGLDSGEAGASRVNYDDVDDYQGFSESPLKSRSGATIANTTGWTRSANVVFVSPSQVEQILGSDQGIKVIAVEVTTPWGIVVEASAFRCRVDKQAK